MTKEDIKLIEYQKAQDSAEHFDTMIWTLISIGIVASIIIFHIFWTDRPENIVYALIMLISGAFIIYYFSFLIEKANQIKIMKYDRCKDIEKDLGLKQHIEVNDLSLSRKLPGIKIFRLARLIIYFAYVLSINSVLFIPEIDFLITYLSIFLSTVVIFAIFDDISNYT